jgi:hypothetical protein
LSRGQPYRRFVDDHGNGAGSPGMDIDWPTPDVPAGGRVERAFTGRVVFQGDDHSYTATTDDLIKYVDYLTRQYYIGLKDGEPVMVSNNPDG